MRKIILFTALIFTSGLFNPDPVKAKRPSGEVYGVNALLPVGYTHATFDGGGIDKLQEWIRLNFLYPRILAESSVQGKVVASFVVDKRGKVVDIKILVTPHQALSAEVVRLLGLSSKMWRPGRNDTGRRISIQYIIPVNCRID